MSLEELYELALQVGERPFAGKQMADWLYTKGVERVEEMTNLSKDTRARIEAACRVGRAAPVGQQRSADGTVKYLFPTADGRCVETVYIPDGKRATLCVSCQVGCKMGCAFCMTGRQGFAGSLSAADILNQVFSLPERERLTNVVFMGQGEPFDNLDAVLRAIRVLTAEWGLGWSPKRVTVSSVGLGKGLVRFIRESACHLAISLHNPFPEGRARLMPAERAFGIADTVRVLSQCDSFRKRIHGQHAAESTRQRRVSFEYILFKGENDTRRHADALIRLLAPLDCRVNLIRFHDIPDTPLRGTGEEEMVRFRDYLTRHGLFTTIRASRGQDILAACGLLSTAGRLADADTERGTPV